MADATPREAPPPPMIGKVGRYTVFLTPPRASGPSESPTTSPGPITSSKVAPLPETDAHSPPSTPQAPPPVQVPPPQFEKPAPKSSGSVLGLFWDAIAKVQDAHSSLDEHLAYWFGLNQSKYQWALNDYFENNGKEKEGGKIGKADC